MWWLVWCALHLLLEKDSGILPSRLFADALISSTVLAGMGRLILNNMSYYLPRKEKYIYMLVVCAVLSSTWFFLVRFILKTMFRSDPVFMNLFVKTQALRFAFAFLMLLCMVMISFVWYTQQEEQELTARKADAERLAKEAELNKLRSQLQPHFLFNSLNSISALTASQPVKARQMIEQLSGFLRGSLQNEERLWTTMEEEFEHLKLYLEIEKVRFGHRLQTFIKVSPDLLQSRLPTLLLQPLVENAIKFGLYDTTGEVNIIISATCDKQVLEIEVENPFDNSLNSTPRGTGFGLSSIRRRLYLLYGRQDLLAVKSEDGKFIATISVPQII